MKPIVSIVVAVMILLVVAVIVHASVPGASGSAVAQSVTPTPGPQAAGPNDVWMSSGAPVLGSVAASAASLGCSPVITVQGSITTTNPVETGRLFRDGFPAACAARKTFPGLFDANPRHYAAHWFTNSSGADRCYTAAVNQSCSAYLTFFATYLNSFNPADPSTNYLADIGNSPAATGEYSFTVPAGANFGVVASEVNQNVGCDNYTLTLKECGCWDMFITGSITNTDLTQTDRLFRDGWAASCSQPKSFPGTTTAGTIHYDAYSFSNTTGVPACFAVDASAPACIGNYIFVSAYLGVFNPSNLSANYLADLGSSPSPSGSFSFHVPAGQAYTLVVNEVNAGASCPAYSLNIRNCGYQACLPAVSH
jgi:hypothetical protein